MQQGGVRFRAGSGDLRVPAGSKIDVEGSLNLLSGGSFTVDPAAVWPGFRVAVVDLVAATVTTAGAVLSWPNPVSGVILVFRPVVYLAAEATGAATVDIGVAANGATSSDTLFDGLDVGAAAGVFEAPSGAGANDAAIRTMAAGEFITGTASATLAGLSGKIVIPYVSL